MKEIEIEEISTQYDVKSEYHSDLMCQNYDAEISGMVFTNGRITIRPGRTFFPDDGFKFIESDPDRVIAIAQMIMSFAQMVKKENQKRVDINANE